MSNLAGTSITHRTKHGHTTHDDASPEYRAWHNMIQRCTNKNNPHWMSYGGRGITVCHEWLKEFRAFLRDMGERPFGCTLDRVDNDSGYHKENCRWATMKAQGRNRRTNRIIEFNGERLSMIEWTEKLGYRKDVIRSRLKEGWTIERALTTPQAKVWRVAGGSGT